MTIDAASWRGFGASVAGPAHRRERISNQDAWSKVTSRRLSAVVVSDGMGSRPYARIGARAACAAMLDVLRVWSMTPSTDVRRLPSAIRANWLLRLGEIAPHDAAATCLFAACAPDGRLVWGRLGDGMVVATRSNGDLDRICRDRPSSFGNVTVALGAGDTAEAWNLDQRSSGHCVVSVLLASDGIADDIREGAEEAFSLRVQSIAETGSHAMRRELHQWPVPHHTDDKTIALLWRERPGDDHHRA